MSWLVMEVIITAWTPTHLGLGPDEDEYPDQVCRKCGFLTLQRARAREIERIAELAGRL